MLHEKYSIDGPLVTVETKRASELEEDLSNPVPSIRQEIRQLYGRSEQGSSSSFNTAAPSKRNKPLSLKKEKEL